MEGTNQLLEGDIQQEIVKTNQALRDSGVELRIRLAGVEKVSYREDDNMQQDLANLRYKASDLDENGSS